MNDTLFSGCIAAAGALHARDTSILGPLSTDAPNRVERCQNCGYVRADHRLGNFSDASALAAAFLVCPTAVWKGFTI